jgi:hypothetical protein
MSVVEGLELAPVSQQNATPVLCTVHVATTAAIVMTLF